MIKTVQTIDGIDEHKFGYIRVKLNRILTLNSIHFKLEGNWHYLNRKATLQVDW